MKKLIFTYFSSKKTENNFTLSFRRDVLWFTFHKFYAAFNYQLLCILKYYGNENNGKESRYVADKE